MRVGTSNQSAFFQYKTTTYNGGTYITSTKFVYSKDQLSSCIQNENLNQNNLRWHHCCLFIYFEINFDFIDDILCD